MARLPQPGSDDGRWGDILNEFLEQAHAQGGALKNGSVTTMTLVNGAVTGQKIASATISEDKLDTATQAKLNASGGSLADDSVTTAKLADGSVTNAKVAIGAAIAKSKLAALAIVDADVDTISQDKIAGLVPALEGKAASSHTHNATDITAGELDVARIPGLSASKIQAGVLDSDRLPAASEGAHGVVLLASDAEVQAGTDTSKAVTSAGVKAALEASQAQANVIFVDAVGDIPPGTPVDTLVVVRAT